MGALIRRWRDLKPVSGRFDAVADGAEGIRTPYLNTASVALSQLSYSPESSRNTSTLPQPSQERQIDARRCRSFGFRGRGAIRRVARWTPGIRHCKLRRIFFVSIFYPAVHTAAVGRTSGRQSEYFRGSINAPAAGRPTGLFTLRRERIR
jgi:hypothetical protein